jgi:putative Mg2+ transporter-C (MgtC) family protein
MLEQLQAWQQLQMASLADSAVSMLAAFLLGGLIGLERQYRQRAAGLRTITLVSLGAAAFVDMANRLQGPGGATHVVAYVVTGVGFLGAGAIMKEGVNVRGLNTAATMWCAAAVGALAGADLLGEAVLVAAFVLGANTLLRPLVNFVNRQPIDESMGEVTCRVYVICTDPAQNEVREAMERLLGEAGYPLGSLEVRPFGAGQVELTATLLSMSVDAEVLDRTAVTLERMAGVSQAFWHPSSAE